MFNVKSKETNEIFNVFAVDRNYDLTKFLIYHNNRWEWVQSDNFEPVFMSYKDLWDSKHAVLKIEEDDNNA